MDFRHELKQTLDFWIKNGVDEKHGGIYTCLDRSGKRYGSDKSVWFQGRALWTFSKAYNIIEKNKDYLKAAETVYSFLDKCTDADGRMFFTVTEDGRELQKRRYFFSETFAVIGCVEYYKATKDETVLCTAEKYFDIAYGCYKGTVKTLPKINPLTRQMKAHSPVMIMFSTAQALRSIPELSAKYEPFVREFLDEIIHGGFMTGKALMENIGADGEFVDSPEGRLLNPGHSMETAWFIMAEGLLKNDESLMRFGKETVDKMLPYGLDAEHGGIISFCDVNGMPPQALEWDMKLWWPQCETMIAARLAYMIFNEEKYLRVYEQLLEYTEKYFMDKKYGEWYGYLHYDNTVANELKGNIFKGPFHIPRFYMIMTVLDETGGFKDYMK